MILFTAVFRVLFSKKLHKRTFPFLWGIITLRLLIPISIPILPSSFDVYRLFGTQKITDKITEKLPESTVSAPPILSVSSIPIENHTPVNPGSELSEVSTSVPVTPSNSVPWLTVLTVIWIIGTALLALYFVIIYVRCMKWFSESLPVSGHEYIDKWLAEHKLLRRKITVRSFDGITSPLTYGIFSPVILLPNNYEQLSEDELNIILTHEYIHIERFDAAFKLVLTAVLCVYWFDPLVWLMYSLANKDIEFACDEAVLCRLGSDEKQKYALTLIRMEELKGSSAPTITGFGDNIFKERIITIMKFKKPTAFTMALSAFLVIGIGTAAFAAASPNVEEPDQEPTVTASEPYSTEQKVWTQREILADKAAEVNVSKAYERFIGTLTMGEHDYIYPDSYGGAYATEDHELIFLAAGDDFSEYQYLQDEFPCVKFRKVAEFHVRSKL